MDAFFFYSYLESKNWDVWDSHLEIFVGNSSGLALKAILTTAAAPLEPHTTGGVVGEVQGHRSQFRYAAGIHCHFCIETLEHLLPFSEYKVHTFDEIDTILPENGLK